MMAPAFRIISTTAFVWEEVFLSANQIVQLRRFASINQRQRVGVGCTHWRNSDADTVIGAAADRRSLRRNRPSHRRLHARRVPGVYCARIYWRVAWDMDRWKAWFAGADLDSRRRHALSDHLVDHRSRAVCRRD